MKTPYYCPLCRLRLSETGLPGNRSDEVVCASGHIWKWTVNEELKTVLTQAWHDPNLATRRVDLPDGTLRIQKEPR